MQNQTETKTTKVAKLGFFLSTIRYWSFLAKKSVRRMFSRYASPKSVATGASVGFFVTMLPVQGFQMMIALPICRALKGNFFSALGPIFITNPITLPFFFFISYSTGAMVTGSTNVLNYEFFRSFTADNMWDKIGDVAFPLIVGSVVLGVVCALLAYPIFYYLASRLKKQREKTRLMWKQRLLEMPAIETVPASIDSAATSKRQKKQAKVA